MGTDAEYRSGQSSPPRALPFPFPLPFPPPSSPPRQSPIRAENIVKRLPGATSVPAGGS